MVIGTLSLAASSAAGLTLAYTGTVGGVAPVATYLHRGTFPGFTPSGTSAGTGTCIAAAPTFPYFDNTALPNVVYFYQVQSIDASTAAILTPQIAGFTQAGSSGGDSVCPVPPPTSTDLQLISPDVVLTYGEPDPGQIAGVVSQDGTSAAISIAFKRADGCPIDCTALVNNGDTVQLKVREVLTGGAAYAATGVFTVASAGQVLVPCDFRSFGGPGVYDAEIAALDATTGLPKLITRFMLLVEPTLWGSPDFTGPLTLAEIRLSLRDSSPAENRLLGGGLSFSNSEIMFAIHSPVQYFNEKPPILDHGFTTHNFPSRYHWRRGAAAILFSIAAEGFRKNNMPTQAGGISLDDTYKAEAYERAYDKAWNEYTTWVTKTKLAMNAEACWGDPVRYDSWGGAYW
jgi:hypothetical protein